MTLPTLLYLIAMLPAVAMCVWAAGSAMLRVEEHRTTHRLATAAGAVLLPFGLFGAAIAGRIGQPQLCWLSPLLPLAIFAGTWSNLMTLRDQGFGVKLLHLPIVVLNSVLLGVYTLRLATDIGGVDLGSWPAALIAVHVDLQCRIGHPAAAMQPVWLHLPFLLPLCLRYRAHHLWALIAGSLLATSLVTAMCFDMGGAFERVSGYRDALPTVAPNAPPAAPATETRRAQSAVHVSWGTTLLDANTRQRIRSQLQDLAVGWITVEVGQAAIDDGRFRQLRDEIEWARRAGLRIAVIATPPRRFHVMPAASLDELRRVMAPVQWAIAERLRPDVLVLFAAPFDSLSRLVSVTPGLQEWQDMIRTAAREVRQANPATRLAVILRSTAPHAHELFRTLKDSGSAIDVVGLGLVAERRSMRDIEQQARVFAAWCERTPGDRSIMILQAGCNGHACGGNRAQARFVRTVLELATRAPQIELCAINSLFDPAGGPTLTNWAGRQGAAYSLLAAFGRGASD